MTADDYGGVTLDPAREKRMRDYLKSLEEASRGGAESGADSGDKVYGVCPNLTDFLSNFTDLTEDNSLGNPTSIVAAILGVIAIAANIASLGAMWNIRSRLSPNQRMIVSLTLSDLVLTSAVCAKILVNPGYLYGMSSCDSYISTICAELVTRGVMISGQLISLLNLACMAFDHFVAINKPLHYSRMITRKHVSMLLAVMWFLAFLFGFTKFWMPASTYTFCAAHQYESYCYSAYCSSYEPEYLLFASVFVTFGFLGFFYTNIYVTIAKYQGISIRNDRYVRRNIKGLVTTIIILVTFLICWLPYCIYEMILTLRIFIDHTSIIGNLELHVHASTYLEYLIIVNSIVNPVIYALRMRDVRRGYYQMINCKADGGAQGNSLNGQAIRRYTWTAQGEQRVTDVRNADELRRISGPRTTESRISTDNIKDMIKRSPSETPL